MEQVRVSLAGLLVVLGACGSAAGRGPDFHAGACPPPPTIGTEPCTTTDCGGNSPIANGFPINGVIDDGSGLCNPQGVRLIPRSLSGGGCGEGADLAFDNSHKQLIGRRAGKDVCRGGELAGATFTVRSYADATLTFTIANVRKFRVGKWEEREGYRIESSGESACEPGAAARIQRRLGLTVDSSAFVTNSGAAPAVAGYQFGAHEDLIIPIADQLYDSADHAIANTQTHWLNLACTGDALAKRSIYQLDTPGDAVRNETTLRMVTANYCGKPYTLRGATFSWTQDTLPNDEAHWGDGKALCLDTPRLAALKLEGGATLAQLPKQLQPKGCEDRACDAQAWTDALRAECGLPSCVGFTNTFLFRSYLNRETGEMGFTAARTPTQATR